MTKNKIHYLRMLNDISNILNVDESVVESFYNLIILYILDRGRESYQSGQDKFTISVPNICDIDVSVSDSGSVTMSVTVLRSFRDTLKSSLSKNESLIERVVNPALDSLLDEKLLHSIDLSFLDE